jgi:hypothetical protein
MTYALWNRVKQMFLLSVTYCFLMSAAGDPYTPQHQLHIQPHPDHHQPDIQAIGNYQTGVSVGSNQTKYVHISLTNTKQ